MKAEVVWKTIDEFPNYLISNQGDVKNKRTEYIKKPGVEKRGYVVFSMEKEGKLYLRTQHIMLARTFIPNPLNKPYVNHKDGNKQNNSIDNLEWVTARENFLHARRTGLHKSDGDKRTAQYTLDGKLVAIYKSASEAARRLGIRRANISGVARGNTKSKTYKGFIWRYV